jgi:hypothetical protein
MPPVKRPARGSRSQPRREPIRTLTWRKLAKLAEKLSKSWGEPGEDAADAS